MSSPAQLLTLPSAGKYACIAADPPWAFKTYSGEAVPQRAEKQHYPTMSAVELAKLPVRDIVAKDAVLIMWLLDSMIEQAFAVGRAWGFEPKSRGFFWRKMSEGGMPYVGLGYWLRKQGELCWLFTRGSPERQSRHVRDVIESPVREHSRKPNDFYRRFEELVVGPRLDLFGREPRKGWDVWGNEPEKFGRLKR